MATQLRPEPMNASPHHPKVKVSLTLGNSTHVAGGNVTGKMEMECRADKGLGIGVMMVELFAIQELSSRDHSATSTFLHSRRIFQGPGLPPSNAVQDHPEPGDPPLPSPYHTARRGISTFLFRFPIPASSPSSIDFGSGLAKVRYELKASVGVIWKEEKRVVTDLKEADVVESFKEDEARVEPEGVVVAENGKIWVHGRVVGGVVVAGESGCVELEVKNHSSKKNTGLTITVSRMLHLPKLSASGKSPLQISDTLTTVPFRGPEYIIPPGAEGVASLVFDIPRYARTVKGGTREGIEMEPRATAALFEVKCLLSVKIGMGFGNKDILLDIPVTVVHPSALPELPVTPPEQYTPVAYPYAPPVPPVSPFPYLDRAQSPYAYPVQPMSPPLQAYVDQNNVWLPPPSHTPNPYHYSPPIQGQHYYYLPPPPVPVYVPPPRPSSAGPSALHVESLPSGLPPFAAPQQLLLPLDPALQQPAEPEEGKGERASRITHHLRLSSRYRSVSPQSHRFPLPASNAVPVPIPQTSQHLPVPPSPISPADSQGVVHSPRPFLSPKHSYSIDPITHNSLPKSERVEELERMAEEVNATKNDLSSDIPLTDASNVNKTLPVPPPTTKDKPTRARIEDYFDPPALIPSDRTPPTPTLTAITPAKVSRNDFLGGVGRTESGLDALERRLLAEVGTRKLDPDDKRPDVRTVLPINIPAPNNVPEPLNDSAISSLTLADHENDRDRDRDRDHDSDTHKAGKSSISGDDWDQRYSHDVRRDKVKKDSHRDRGGPSSAKTETDGERRHGRKKERTKDGEGRRRKKSVKGRVAAWLGGIDPDVLPVDIPPLPSPEPVQEASEPVPDLKPEQPSDETTDVSSPNPRSSGFVPIGTLKRNTPPRHAKPPATNGAQEVKMVADVSSSHALKDRSPTISHSPVRTPQPLKTDRLISPPSSDGDLNDHLSRKYAHADLLVTGKKVMHPSPRLPVFPPPLDPEVKYDVRSARGGRGGKVTAVASIWASGAISDSKPKDPLKPYPNGKSPLLLNRTQLTAPEPKLLDFAGNQGVTRPVFKSTSVPASISSSHATPTLSSTASLARPSSSPNKAKPPVKLPPTISEGRPEGGKIQTGPKAATKPTTPGDLAFGQARLRDLIKKYQGQSA